MTAILKIFFMQSLYSHKTVEVFFMDKIAESVQQCPIFCQIAFFNHVLLKKFFWHLNLIYSQVIEYKMFDVLHLLFCNDVTKKM